MSVSRVLTLGLLISLAAAATAQADPIGTGSAVDAYINFGTGPYAGASLIASGTPQAWYESPQVAALFGGTPTAQQQQQFEGAVMQDIQTAFRLSGIPVTLTDNPSVNALHTLNLVSNASSSPFPGAIGTTDIGANGFSFIDGMAQAAQSVTQLEWIAAHNISHELMLAFGVPENYDQTGNYLDARNANLAMMINPGATFSAPAAAAIRSNLGEDGFQQVLQSGAQGIEAMATATPTPEPSAVILWGTLTAAAVAAGRSRRRAR